jgi:hypothetical protein
MTTQRCTYLMEGFLYLSVNHFSMSLSLSLSLLFAKNVVTMLLQCCYNVVTMLLQCCYNVVTMLLQVVKKGGCHVVAKQHSEA